MQPTIHASLRHGGTWIADHMCFGGNWLIYEQPGRTILILFPPLSAVCNISFFLSPGLDYTTMKFLCLHGAIGNVDVSLQLGHELFTGRNLLTISKEHQYPAWYAARESPIDTIQRRTLIANYGYHTAPLQKDLGQDQSASFHYINAPVKITPPAGMRLFRSLHPTPSSPRYRIRGVLWRRPSLSLGR